MPNFGQRGQTSTHNTMKRQEYLYKVSTHSTKAEAFYWSVEAIFEDHTAEELGVAMQELREQTAIPYRPYFTELCAVTKYPVRRKQQRHPHKKPGQPQR